MRVSTCIVIRAATSALSLSRNLRTRSTNWSIGESFIAVMGEACFSESEVNHLALVTRNVSDFRPA